MVLPGSDNFYGSVPKSSMILPVLFMTAQFCIAQIHPEQRTIPIVSDEHGILHFGDPFEQNENTQEHSPAGEPQLTGEEPLFVDFSSVHITQPQVIRTQLTDDGSESFSADLSQPLYAFMGRTAVHQYITDTEALQQEIPPTLSQEAVVKNMNVESTSMHLERLLAYGDLGPVSADGINIDALSLNTDVETLLNDTSQFGHASMKDAKNQPNMSDQRVHLQIPASFSDSTNEKIRSLDEKRDENMAYLTSADSASGQALRSILSNSSHSFVQSRNLENFSMGHICQKPFQCDICAKQFRTSSNFRAHQRTHTGEKPFQCDICAKQFRTPGDCHRHGRIHTGEMSLQCDICLKQFRTSSNFRTHQRTHTGEKPFQCDVCLKQFRTSSNYRTHQRTHTGGKQFQCDICPKQFATSSNYRTHRRTHTGEKPFKCDFCQKEFSDCSNFRTHQQTHIGEKSFQCDICAKLFRSSSSCKSHRRIHTGEKPFQCDICPKQFRTSSSYHTHRRTHTGEKPFQCDFCQKEFSDHSNYRTHRRIHMVRSNSNATYARKRHRQTHANGKLYTAADAVRGVAQSID